MLCLWTALSILFVTGGVWGQMYTASACFGRDPMHLNCSDSRRIFILKMLFGSKTSESLCFQNSTCASKCCEEEPSDCFSNYTDLTFALVYETHRCWNNFSCSSQVSHGPTPCSVHPNVSTYAIADYSCLRSEDITAFHRNTTISAPAVAIHYDHTDTSSYPVASSGKQTWYYCQVDTADCVQRQADVILVKENETVNPNDCSSVGWSAGHFLPCNRSLRYLSFNISTPFRVSLLVDDKKRDPNGWAVVRAQDGSDLSVQCGYTNISVIPNCTAPSTTPSSTASPTTTTAGSSRGTDTSTSSTTPTSPSVTMASSTSRETSTAYLTSSSASVPPGNTSPSTASNTGAVVGGVVAAVVVLVVVAALAVFFFLKRRAQKPGAETKPPRIRKSSLRMPLTSMTSGSTSSPRPSESGFCNSLDVADGDYDRIGQVLPHPNGNPTVHGLPVNPRTPAADPDYDQLGQKKSQSSSSNPAAPYGRLGEVGGGGQDTDYSYDHLASGRQPAPAVIDSDYNMPGLTTEGDYNVAGIPKKQHVITGSPYDTAEIVTSEGDYNRVDFQGRKQHVITGSNYDTAEIMTTDGDYNRVNFQGKKQKVVTGSQYDRAEVTTDNAEIDDVRPGTSARVKVGGDNYDLAQPVVL